MRLEAVKGIYCSNDPSFPIQYQYLVAIGVTKANVPNNQSRQIPNNFYSNTQIIGIDGLRKLHGRARKWVGEASGKLDEANFKVRIIDFVVIVVV